MKKAVIVLAVLCLLLTAIPAKAESIYVRKIISVVYDDSSSMHDSGSKNWAYANYAMQAFTALLSEEDQLYITYMSDTNGNTAHIPPMIDLSAEKIQESTDEIRNHTRGDGTPFWSIDVAYRKLASITESSANTQYWLVVLTDGSFQDLKGDIAGDKLREKLLDCTKAPMQNGLRPKVIYMPIGEKASDLKDDPENNFFVYGSRGSEDIVSNMAQIADQVSGRTRVDPKKIRLLDDKTIEISSDVPLFNIAVLSQKTDASVAHAEQTSYSSETGRLAELTVARNVRIRYPEVPGWQTDTSLKGRAFRIQEISGENIPAGTYTFTFDTPVTKDDFVVMLEPALEVRMTVLRNGEETDDFFNLHENDQIELRCGIFESGTDHEIDSGLLPKGTEFSVSVKENGTIVSETTGKDMHIDGIRLHEGETSLSASVEIKGFSPITVEYTFLTLPYEPIYTIRSVTDPTAKTVKRTELGNSSDKEILFEICRDGVPMTAEEVRQLAPEIVTDPSDCLGSVEYRSGGIAAFIPQSIPDFNDDFREVSVICTVGEVSAEETLTVLGADFEVHSIPAEESICKTRFYGNSTGVSFYITKDGVKLNGAELQNGYSVYPDDSHRELLIGTKVSEDGTVFCYPYEETERRLNFGRWWINWAYYWGKSGKDVEITFAHRFGSAAEVIDVTGESLWYVLLCVWAPFLLELLLLASTAAYLIRYFTKARFVPNAVLYVGSIAFSRRTNGHTLILNRYPLAQYNTFRNLWNPFRELTVPVGGFQVTALYSGQISCNAPAPWYGARIKSSNPMLRLSSPKQIYEYYTETGSELAIQEIPSKNVITETNGVLSQDEEYYCVRATVDMIRTVGNMKREVIEDAYIICYSGQ